MAITDVLKKRATALAGAPPPGDARAAARIISDLCEHVSALENAMAELIRQVQDTQSELAELKRRGPPTN